VSPSDSNYKVGPGKPPLHTRFQKGQSGNPSGKPGPAKLARQRFQRILFAALEGRATDLKDACPEVGIEIMARRIVLDALGGNLQAMKLILAEFDKEMARSEPEAAAGNTTEEAPVESEERATDQPPPLEDYARWCKASEVE
jgi:hypothetical protein